MLIYEDHKLALCSEFSVSQIDFVVSSISKNQKGYFHLCPRMDFLQTLQINNSLYTNYENVFIER